MKTYRLSKRHFNSVRIALKLISEDGLMLNDKLVDEYVKIWEALNKRSNKDKKESPSTDYSNDSTTLCLHELTKAIRCIHSGIDITISDFNVNELHALLFLEKLKSILNERYGHMVTLKTKGWNL